MINLLCQEILHLQDYNEVHYDYTLINMFEKWDDHDEKLLVIAVIVLYILEWVLIVAADVKVSFINEVDLLFTRKIQDD